MSHSKMDRNDGGGSSPADEDDLRLAEQRLAAIRSGYSQPIPLERVMWRYGLRAGEQVLNHQTRHTLASSERGEDVHHAKDADDLFRQLGL